MVSSLDKHSAADQWGYFNEHWQQLTEFDSEDTVLSTLIPLFLNRLLPQETRKQVNSTKGVALDKKLVDLRPLGVSLKLRLIPTSYSNSLHTRKLKDKEGRTLDEGAMREFKEFFLAHNQFGIGVPGGLEAMIHLIQLHVETQQQNAVSKWDVQNAFNRWFQDQVKHLPIVACCKLHNF